MNALRTTVPALVTILLSALTPVVAAAPDVGAAAAGPLTLWYDEPATDWETRSPPIGNGAVDRMAVRPRALAAGEVPNWRSLVFG